MGKFKDLTGETFGRLTVIGLDHSEKVKRGTRLYWNCRCSCENGTIITVRGDCLKDGTTQSCGCLMREKNAERMTTHGKHGKKIYFIWQSMLDRCKNPNNKRYPRYGGRGIKVCERWLKFENFYEDVSTLEHFGEKGYSLDRIDNNKGYEPENVRWAKMKEQQRNTRRNIFVEYEGEMLILKDAAQKSGISYAALKYRYSHGKRGDDLFKPVKGGRKNCIEPENIMKS